MRAYGILDLYFIDAFAVSEPIAKRFRALDVLGAEHAIQSAWRIGSSELSRYFERGFQAYDYRVLDIAIALKTFPFAKLSGLLPQLPGAMLSPAFKPPLPT